MTIIRLLILINIKNLNILGSSITKTKKIFFIKIVFAKYLTKISALCIGGVFHIAFSAKLAYQKCIWMAFFFHDMYIQAIFCCKASFKNGTFERFSSFMHWRHVFSSANLILQNMRIDDLFSSWTDAKCLLLFVSKIAHKNCIEKVYLLYTRIDFMRSFKADLGICTGKSLSEALILGSTNPQYDKILFIDLPVQYMKTTS